VSAWAHESANESAIIFFTGRNLDSAFSYKLCIQASKQNRHGYNTSNTLAAWNGYYIIVEQEA
jgi:hypothetical protein